MMVLPIRLLVVLLTFFLAPPVGAEDKPPAKPVDARRDALVQAGYTHVPLTLYSRLLRPGVPVPTALLFYVDGAVGLENEKVKFVLDSGYLGDDPRPEAGEAAEAGAGRGGRVRPGWAGG